jgi:GMP synthase-like glutamine amidotransferase
MPSCLVVQHVEPERAFAIEVALVASGVEVDTRRVFAGDPVPILHSGVDAGFDGLVVMGGPMSAASDQDFPTRRAELSLIAGAIARGVPTLGVCLGAQLVALASGGSVYQGAAGPEIGWGPVELLAECADDPLLSGLAPSLTVLHWHGDTFDLPPDSRRLIRNATYDNQAFRVGQAAWGLQFHLEVDRDAVDGFLAAFAEDAAGAPGGAGAIRGATPAALAALARARTLIFDRFAAQVAARVSSDLVGSG